MKEVGDILQLGDVVGAVAAVLLQKGQDVVELGTRVLRIESRQLGVDNTPSGDLLLRVFHSGNLLSTQHFLFFSSSSSYCL